LHPGSRWMHPSDGDEATATRSGHVVVQFDRVSRVRRDGHMASLRSEGEGAGKRRSVAGASEGTQGPGRGGGERHRALLRTWRIWERGVGGDQVWVWDDVCHFFSAASLGKFHGHSLISSSLSDRDAQLGIFHVAMATLHDRHCTAQIARGGVRGWLARRVGGRRRAGPAVRPAFLEISPGQSSTIRPQPRTTSTLTQKRMIRPASAAGPVVRREGRERVQASAIDARARRRRHSGAELHHGRRQRTTHQLQ